MMKGIFISLAILCFASCHEEVRVGNAEPRKTRNEVTLLFESTELFNQGDTFLLGIVYDTIHLRVRYVDKYYRSISKAVNKGETIIIPVKQEQFEFGLGVIRHGPTKYNYRVLRGDSVLISTRGGTPYVTILNREFDSTSLNTSHYLSRPGDEKFVDGMDFYFVRDPEKRKARIREYREHFARKNDILDSMFKAGSIEQSAYSLHQKNLNGNEIIFEMWLRHNNKSISLEESGPYDPIQILSETTDFNDSSALFSPIMQMIFGQYLIGELVNYQRNAEKETQYTLAYDSIQKYPGLPSFQKEYLMALCIYRMPMLESTPVVNEYIEKFNKYSKNAELKEFINKNFLVELNFLQERKDSLMLISSAGKKTDNFMNVLEAIDTEYAYLDVWASWCQPCIAAMPASEKLRAQFKDKITFIYLSVDKEMDPWEKASTRHNLLYYENNYLLLNPENAAVFRDLNIQTLPRYLLFNQKGQILDSNCPSPQENGILASYFNSLK